MPRADEHRKQCRYCGLRRGMQQGTDMCLQCNHLYETVRDNLPTLERLIPVKFPEYTFMKMKNDDEIIEQIEEHAENVRDGVDDMLDDMEKGEDDEPVPNPNP